MKNINFAFLLIVILSFFSCEKEIPLNSDQADPKLVFNSIFEAEDTLWVNLQRSKSVLDESTIEPMITGATIALHTENGDLVGTLSEIGNGDYYLASPTPVVGIIYELRAQKPGYTSIKAQSQAPLPIVPAAIDTLTNSQNEFEFSISINDPSSETNYYSVSFLSF